MIAAMLLCVLSGCADHYSFSSNLDNENFRDYYAPMTVKIYQNEQHFSGHYRYIGLVEGQDCQRAKHLAAPDEKIARTQARAQAFAQSANAVIFTGCVEVEAKQCTAMLVCYAKAYLVESVTEESAQK